MKDSEQATADKKAASRRAAMRRKLNKRKKEVEIKFAEDKEVEKKLMKKYSSKKGKEADTSVLKIRIKGEKEKIKIENPESHNNVIAKAEEYHSNKQYQLELRSDSVCSAWKCAACGQRSSVDELGDLYGPYYVRINPDNWPSFLAKKPPLTKGKQKDFFIDVWLHGDCALRLPHVHLRGAELINLEEEINNAWKQHCSICHELGAHVPGASHGVVHYPCAKKKGIMI